MSDAKFSSGPWSFDSPCFDQKIPVKGGVTAFGRPYVIAHINRPGSAYAGQAEANARLIAAAPELLEATKALLLLDCPITGADPFGPSVVEHWKEQKAQGHGYADVYLNAIAAIAKALGEGQ